MNQPTFHLTRSRGTGYAVAGFSRACLIRLIDFPEMPLRTRVLETIKSGGTALLIRTEFPLASRRVHVAYKRVRRRNWWKILTGLLGTNRQLRTWRLGQELLKKRIATPKPLAVIVPRWYQVGAETYLAVEWIDGARNLRQVAGEFEATPYSYHGESRRAATVAIGELLARMHDARISHRDLKATNLLLKSVHDGVEAYVIDLDGARNHFWRLSWRQRYSNLSRLELSAREFEATTSTDRLRLLKAYLATSAGPKPDWKTAWRELAAIAHSRGLSKLRRAA